MIDFDIAKRRLELDVPHAEIDRRLAAWAPPLPKFEKGVMAKYARSVSSASIGAITR